MIRRSRLVRLARADEFDAWLRGSAGIRPKVEGKWLTKERGEAELLVIKMERAGLGLSIIEMLLVAEAVLEAGWLLNAVG
jgi:hypothetical protein